MKFLAPALLVGLLGLALPVVAHLFGRQRPREIQFAAVHLLEACPPAKTRKRTLHDRWLLVARMLALGAGLLLFARPYLVRTTTVTMIGAPHDAVLLLDTSASTNLVVDGRPTHALLEAALLDFSARVPPGSQIGFATTDPRGPRAPLGVSTAAQFLDALARHQARAGARTDATTMADAIPGVAELFDPPSVTENRPRVIYAFGDLTQRGLAGLPSSVAPEIAVVPVPLEPTTSEVAHVGIERMAIEDALDVSAESRRVRVDVRGYGPIPDGDTVSLALAIGGTTLARAQVSLDETGRAQAQFLVDRPDIGATPVTARIVDRNDPLPHDDVRHGWLRASQSINLKIVNGAPSEDRRFDEVYFLSTALEALEAIQPARVSTISPDQLAQLAAPNGDGLANVDVLILANTPAPNAATAEMIERFVREGGGLWITAGDRVNARDYNETMRGVLPLELRGRQAVGSLPGQTRRRKEGVAPPALSHPLFAADTDVLPLQGFESAATETVMLVEPDVQGRASVALSFERGAPALLTRPIHEGRVALLTTSLDRDWSTLVLDASFVPLVQRLLRWLSLGSDVRRFGELDAGRPLTLPREARGARSITLPGNDTVPIAAAADGEDRPRVALRETLALGHYTVEDQAGEILAGYAVNVDPRESVTTAPARDAAATRAEAAPSSDVEHRIPLARGLALFALILVALEGMLRLVGLVRRG